MKLRQFDLEFSITAAGALREYVEYQLGAVDGFEARGVFEGTSLSRFQVDIKNGDIRAAAHGGQGDSLEAPLADNGARMYSPARQRQHLRDLDSGCPHKLRYFRPGRFPRSKGKDQGALLLCLACPSSRQPGKLALECPDLVLEVKSEVEDIPGFDLSKRLNLMRITIHSGQDVGKLDLSRVAVFLHLDRCNQVQSQQSEVVQVVLSEGFAAQVCVDKAESAESSGAPTEPPDIGKIDVRRIAKNHIANVPVAGYQNADLSPKLFGERGKMPGQFRRYDLLGLDAPAERPFQSAPLGLLDSQNVAVYLLNGLCPPSVSIGVDWSIREPAEIRG